MFSIREYDQMWCGIGFQQKKPGGVYGLSRGLIGLCIGYGPGCDGLNPDFLIFPGEIFHKFDIKIRKHHSDSQKILLARCFKRLRCPEYRDMALAAFFLCLQFHVL